MSTGIEFHLGMDAGDFIREVTQSEDSLKKFNQAAHNAGRHVSEAGHEVLGMREKVEIARHSLDAMGGSFGMLGEFARMALDPMTVGFAALFAAVEFVNKSLEASNERMKEFAKQGMEVEKIVKGIVAARPTGTEEWMAQVKQAAAASHPKANLNFYADLNQDAEKERNKNQSDAVQEGISLEEKKVELLRDQGRISAADAAKRLEALKNEAVLQKNIAETLALKSEISGRQADLDEVRRQQAANPLNSAFEKKQAADAKVNDLQKQLEELPKAIAGEKNLQKEAEEKSKAMYLNPHERGQWLDQSSQAGSRADQLQAQLNRARGEFTGAANDQAAASAGYENAQGYNARGTELTQQLTTLKSKLGTTQDRQRKMTPMELERNRIEAMEAATKGEKSEERGGGKHKTEATSLEKMGFVMGGGNSPMQETNNILRQMLAQQRAQHVENKMGGGIGPSNQI